MSLAGDGFDTVVRAKAEAEKKCPGVVPCADILAIAARDVVNMVIDPEKLSLLSFLLSHGSSVSDGYCVLLQWQWHGSR